MMFHLRQGHRRMHTRMRIPRARARKQTVRRIELFNNWERNVDAEILHLRGILYLPRE